ncbi:MAG: glycosyltransferase family 39 protein [Candidatus Kapabacteria bacterium]|nr:glycosyltransferase family 39 protein [Candidatus Kapabacteria bacterium]
MKKAILLSLAIFLLLLVVYFYYQYIINSCSGHFIYGLDDTYIHLSLAKNFLESGNFGINHEEFGFATSSPLWTVILIIIFKIFGYNELVPFYLNILISILIIILSLRIVNKSLDNLPSLFSLIILIILSIPIIPMIFIGMEHLLHLLISLLFISVTLNLKYEQDKKTKNLIFLAILSILLTLVRYEAIFLIIATSIFMIMSPIRIKYFLIVAFFAIVPHIIIGFYSISYGGLFFPNPILLKGYEGADSIISFIQRYVYSGVINLVENSHLLVAFLISIGLLIYIHFQNKNNFLETLSKNNIESFNENFPFQEKTEYVKDLILIFLITSIFHLQFAKTGWFYRYEAYLVGIFLIFLLPFLAKLLIGYTKKTNFFVIAKGRFLFILLSILLILPFIHRGIESHNKLRFAPINIYEQQFHISRFLDKYYKNQPIGMNDIGLVSLSTNVKVIDVYGLADNNITKAKFDGVYSPEYFYDYLKKKNCNILVIFDAWFKKEIKYNTELIRVATWKIENNEVCGMDEVTFYTLDLQKAENLKTYLEKYKEIMPKTINLRILI